jgi:hypothetical protein
MVKKMKNHSIAILVVLCLSMVSVGHAQANPSGKSLASTMDVYVFPKKGQQTDQQSMDEAACYEWAVTNSGNDPFSLQKQSVEQAQQSEQSQVAAQQSVRGTGARGALGGAAVGALVGEIANDDAGKGAVYGAVAGGLLNRRRAKRSANQATAQVEQQGQAQQQANQEQIGNFKKAFSVCLEAKDYLVKF